MAIFDSIERLGRAIFESSFSGTHDAPELAEIRLAVLDAVTAAIEPERCAFSATI